MYIRHTTEAVEFYIVYTYISKWLENRVSYNDIVYPLLHYRYCTQVMGHTYFVPIAINEKT
jgi:hypothetical protein